MNWRLNRSSLSAAMAVCGLFASLMAVAPSRLLADEADCNRSVTRYNAALNNVGIAVQRYSSCTGASAGRNECKREFNLLKSADDDYRDAVSDYRSDCK